MKLRMELKFGGQIQKLWLAPDGSIAFVIVLHEERHPHDFGPDHNIVCDLRTGNHRELATDGNVHGSFISRDSKVLITPGIDFISLRDGRRLQRIPAAEFSVRALSPDGSFLLVSTHQQFRRFEVVDGSVSWEFARSGGRAEHLAISDDGARFALVERKSIIIGDTRDGRTFQEIRVSFPRGVFFTPNGAEVFCPVLGRDETTLRFWNVQTGKPTRTVRSEIKMSGFFSISPDGSRYIGNRFQDQKAIYVFSTQTGKLLSTVPQYLTEAYLSEDNRTLAGLSMSSERQLCVYDIEVTHDAPAVKTQVTKSQTPQFEKAAAALSLERKVVSANEGAKRHSPVPPFDLLSIPGMLDHAKVAVRLHPRRGTIKDLAASKIAGSFAWPKDEPWPQCEEHDDKLIPVLQITRTDVPELPFPEKTDLFQVLWCPNDHVDCFVALPRIYWRRAPDEPASLKRMPNRPVEFMQEYVLKACVLSPERVIEFGDYSDELQERLASLEIVDDNAALALQSPIADGWKIGGYPKWIQSPDTPICPSCGQPMEHLLSIDSEEFDSMSEDRWMATEDARRGRSSNWKTQEAISRPTGIMLGDVGCQYYFVCRQCDPNRVVTVFQSS